MWAGKDRTAATLRRFFDDLGPDQAAALTHISADGAEWIHTVAAERAPRAVLCLDAFHVVAWATKALDEVRRGLAAQLRRTGRVDQATTIKHWQSPETVETSIVGSCGRGRAPRAGAAGLLGLPALWSAQGL